MHSLSPALHRAAYAELGLDWRYDACEVDAAGLADFVAGCGPEWRGLSLTMPLKEAALALGTPDADAVLARAANTLVLDPAGHRAANTDVGGLVDALRAAGLTTVATAVLLGAGATARSAVVSLVRLGCRRLTVLARTPDKARPLVDLGRSLDLDVTVRSWVEPVPRATLAVSTVTSAAAGVRADEVADAAEVVFDAVYDPWPTPLAAAAVDRGRILVSGLDLLACQAVRQIELMTGSLVPAALLLEAGRSELAVRSAPA